jgi:hypothetical protein
MGGVDGGSKYLCALGSLIISDELLSGKEVDGEFDDVDGMKYSIGKLEEADS